MGYVWATDSHFLYTYSTPANIRWSNGHNIPWVYGSTKPFTEAKDLFHYRLPSHWMSRRLVGTAKGFASLGPLSCYSGDLICVILGCRTSIILRPVDGHFEIMGKCYVHGTRGEAMADLDAGQYILRNFEIW